MGCGYLLFSAPKIPADTREFGAVIATRVNPGVREGIGKVSSESSLMSAKLLPRPVMLDDCEIEMLARRRLSAHSHFRGRFASIRISCRDGCLKLTGQLPSFYLKQLLQTAVRDIDGVQEIVNDVFVANPRGVSGETPVMWTTSHNTELPGCKI